MTRGIKGSWLRSQRRARGWDMPRMAHRLAAAAGEDRGTLPDQETLTGYIRRWEAGRVGVSERYELLFAKAFGMDPGEMEAAASAPRPVRPDDALDPTDDPLDFIELTRRAEQHDAGHGALEMLRAVTDRLCRDYPAESAEDLASRGTGYLRCALDRLDGRVTLAQHRELLVIGGWLAALLGCLHYDLGNTGSAEAARVMARNLGQQAGHGEIIAWSCELAAWFALVEGRHADVVRWAQAGMGHAGRTNAAVQLALQAARGYARMGDDRAIQALRIGQRILDQLPEPEYPEHHFTVDQDKYDFYAGTIWTWLGTDDATAATHAKLAIAKCVLPSGRVRWPMRVAVSKLDLAVIADRRGDLDEAVAHATAALQLPRWSAQLLPRAAELGHSLAARHQHELLVREYLHLVHARAKLIRPGASA